MVLTELETRCAHCKGGLVCPDEWQAWVEADKKPPSAVDKQG